MDAKPKPAAAKNPAPAKPDPNEGRIIALENEVAKLRGVMERNGWSL